MLLVEISTSLRVVNCDKSEPFPACILNPCTPMLGTESGTEFVVKRYKTLHNVESAATKGRMTFSL